MNIDAKSSSSHKTTTGESKVDILDNRSNTPGHFVDCRDSGLQSCSLNTGELSGKIDKLTREDSPILLEEVFTCDYDVTNEEVVEYVERLGFRPPLDPELLSLAKRALLTPLPAHWTPVKEKSNEIYYFNKVTGESTWTHPIDASFRDYINKSKGSREKTATDTDSCVEDLKTEEEEADNYLRKKEDLFDSLLNSSSTSLSLKETPPSGRLKQQPFEKRTSLKPVSDNNSLHKSSNKHPEELNNLTDKKDKSVEKAFTPRGMSDLAPIRSGLLSKLPPLGSSNPVLAPLKKTPLGTPPIASLSDSMSPNTLTAPLAPITLPLKPSFKEKISLSSPNLAAPISKPNANVSNSGSATLRSKSTNSKISKTDSSPKSIIKKPNSTGQEKSPEKKIHFNLDLVDIAYHESDDEEIEYGTPVQNNKTNIEFNRPMSATNDDIYKSKISNSRQPGVLIGTDAKNDPWADEREENNIKSNDKLNSLSRFKKEQEQNKELAKAIANDFAKSKGMLKTKESDNSTLPTKDVSSLKPSIVTNQNKIEKVSLITSQSTVTTKNEDNITIQTTSQIEESKINKDAFQKPKLSNSSKESNELTKNSEKSAPKPNTAKPSVSNTSANLSQTENTNSFRPIQSNKATLENNQKIDLNVTKPASSSDVKHVPVANTTNSTTKQTSVGTKLLENSNQQTNNISVKTKSSNTVSKQSEQTTNFNQQTKNTSQQKSNTNQQATNTNQQKSNTNQQKSNTNQQAINTNQQKSNTNQQATNTNQQATNTNQQKTNTNQQATNTNQQKSNTNQQATNTNQQATNTNQQATNTNQQATNTNQQKSNTNQQATNIIQQKIDSNQQTKTVSKIKTPELELEDSENRKKQSKPLEKLVSKLTDNKNKEFTENVPSKSMYDGINDEEKGTLISKENVEEGKPNEAAPPTCSECERRFNERSRNGLFATGSSHWFDEEIPLRWSDQPEELDAELKRKREDTLLEMTSDTERGMNVILREKQLQLKRQHTTAMRDLRSELEDNLLRIKREGERKEMKEREMQSSRLKYLHEQYKLDLESLQLSHQQALDDLRKQNEIEIEKMKMELRQYILSCKEQLGAELQEPKIPLNKKSSPDFVSVGVHTSFTNGLDRDGLSREPSLNEVNGHYPIDNKFGENFDKIFLKEMREIRKEIASIKNAQNENSRKSESVLTCQHGSKYRDIRKRYSDLRRRIKEEKMKMKNINNSEDSSSSTNSSESKSNYPSEISAINKLHNDSSTTNTSELSWKPKKSIAVIHTSTPKKSNKPLTKNFLIDCQVETIETPDQLSEDETDWLTKEGNRILAQTEKFLNSTRFLDNDDFLEDDINTIVSFNEDVSINSLVDDFQTLDTYDTRSHAISNAEIFPYKSELDLILENIGMNADEIKSEKKNTIEWNSNKADRLMLSDNHGVDSSTPYRTIVGINSSLNDISQINDYLRNKWTSYFGDLSTPFKGKSGWPSKYVSESVLPSSSKEILTDSIINLDDHRRNSTIAQEVDNIKSWLNETQNLTRKMTKHN